MKKIRIFLSVCLLLAVVASLCPMAMAADTAKKTYYSQTFLSNGGEPNSFSVIKNSNTLPSPLPTATKAGYRLEGWYYNDGTFSRKVAAGEATTATRNTFIAKWVKVCTITFNTNGADGNVDPMEADADAIVPALPQPTKAGYAFKGWFYDEKLTKAVGTDDKISSDVTLYAKWAEGYTVTFNSNSADSQVPATVVAKGESFESLPEPGRNGYAFMGWFYDEKLTKAAADTDAVNSDITLYAKWTEGYTISFETNGGDSSVPSVTIAKGEKLPELPTVTKAKATLAGWYSDEALTKKVKAGDAVKSDMCLYAKYSTNAGQTGSVFGDSSITLLLLCIVVIETAAIIVILAGRKKKS